MGPSFVSPFAFGRCVLTGCARRNFYRWLSSSIGFLFSPNTVRRRPIVRCSFLRAHPEAGQDLPLVSAAKPLSMPTFLELRFQSRRHSQLGNATLDRKKSVVRTS